MYESINRSHAWKENENILSCFSDLHGVSLYLVSSGGALDGFFSENPYAKQFYYDIAVRLTGLLINARRELPAFFSEPHGTSFFAQKTKAGTVICGPVLHSRIQKEAFSEQFEESNLSIEERIRYVDSFKYMPVVDYRRFIEMSILFNKLINNSDISFDELMAHRRLFYYHPEKTDYEYNRERFLREPFPAELQDKISAAVCSGDADKLKKLLSEINKWNFSFHANNPIRGYRLTFAVIAGKIMNDVRETGVGTDTAIDLCEYYLNWADKAKTVEELISIIVKMLYDFTDLVKIRKYDNISDVTRSFERMVQKRVEDRIVLSELAKEMKITPQYLCTRVKGDLGVSPNSYIHKVKTEEAQRILKNGEMPISELWLHLGYCDQSHFNKVFKEYTGKSPGAFARELLR